MEPFSAIIKVPGKSKLVFKFIIDGAIWTTNDHYKTEIDRNGNQNNYVEAEELTPVEEFSEQPLLEPDPKREPEDLGEPNGCGFLNTEASNDGGVFTRVLTLESYASVSLASNDSTFEHLSQNRGHASNRNTPEEPAFTNSEEEEAHVSQRSGPQLSDSEATTIGPSSCNNSFTGVTSRLSEEENIGKPTKSTILRDLESNRRKDGLMSRFCGLFRP